MDKQLSFEEALSKLEDIIISMEDGEISLEKSLEYYKEGLMLTRFCSRKLEDAEKEIKIINESDIM